MSSDKGRKVTTLAGTQSQTIYDNNFVGYLYPPTTWKIPHTTYNDISVNGGGNYWSSYTGTDLNLDGIGDTPYMLSGGGGRDGHLFMLPNAWLRGFALTVNANSPWVFFEINGTDFSIGGIDWTTLRLGYSANYAISLPRQVTLLNGSVLTFEKWGDGVTNPTRTMFLNADSSVQVVYALTAAQTTTTSSTGTTSTSSASTTHADGPVDHVLYATAGVVAVVAIIVVLVIVLSRRHKARFGQKSVEPIP